MASDPSGSAVLRSLALGWRPVSNPPTWFWTWPVWLGLVCAFWLLVRAFPNPYGLFIFFVLKHIYLCLLVFSCDVAG